MKNIFLKNHRENVVEKLLPDSFLKSKLNISLHQQSEVSYSLFFIVSVSLGMPKHIETKVLISGICFI